MKQLALGTLIALLGIGSASADYATDVESSMINSGNTNYTTLPATSAGPTKPNNHLFQISEYR